MGRPIADIERDLATAREEENTAYWLFTRTARGKPVSPTITRRVVKYEDELRAARHSLTEESFHQRHGGKL